MADFSHLTAKEVRQLLSEGKLDDVLAGRSDDVPEPERPPQRDLRWLSDAKPEQVAQALRNGELADLLNEADT
jgi:hypothetical protein